jgi:peroxiredoxin
MLHDSTLQRGDLVPHFAVRTVEGETFDYTSIWQNEQLVLIVLPDASRVSDEYASALRARKHDFSAEHTTCAITRDQVPGVRAPAALVVDRWGEILHAVSVADVSQLPSAEELLDWARYVQSRCPECEGEAY